MRLALPVLTLAIGLSPLGGCFDPQTPVVPGADESSSGSESDTGAEPDSSAGSDDSDNNDDQAMDSTGPEDLPPEIISFTIDGTTTPAEQQNAGVVLFDVDATDDIGIDRVEIYDGETLVATMVDAPYQAELLLSSADNGSHEYTARAYDTAAQSVASEAIIKSVNIIGGVLLELREDIGETYSPVLYPLPRLGFGNDGDIYVAYTSPPNILNRTTVEVQRYQAGLSLVWEETINPPGTSAFAMSPPLVTSTGELLIGSIESQVQPMSTMTVYRADALSAQLGEPISLDTNNTGYGFPVIDESANGLLLSPSLNTIESRSLDLLDTVWSQEQFSGTFEDTQNTRGITGVDTNADGSILVTFIPPDPVCAKTNSACIRKLGPDGTTLWTRPAAGSIPLSRPLTARFDSNSNAITAWASDSNGLHVVIYDTGGKQVTEFELLVGEALLSYDLAIDPQGCLVVVGLLNTDGYHPWVARVTQQGELLWSTIYDELEPGDFGSMLSSIVISDEGRTYIAGISTLTQGDFLELFGVGWLAEIEL